MLVALDPALQTSAGRDDAQTMDTLMTDYNDNVISTGRLMDVATCKPPDV